MKKYLFFFALFASNILTAVVASNFSQKNTLHTSKEDFMGVQQRNAINRIEILNTNPYDDYILDCAVNKILLEDWSLLNECRISGECNFPESYSIDSKTSELMDRLRNNVKKYC